MEVIILAGGLGTRLQSEIGAHPKCLAPINGQPFLHYLLKKLESQMVDHVVLSLGYKAEEVIEYLRTKAFTFKVSWVIEKEPLGTGGAIKHALRKCTQKDVVIMNGDTYFDIPLHEFTKYIIDEQVQFGLVLRHVPDASRYGLVSIDEHQEIVLFHEKDVNNTHEGLINGGIYYIRRAEKVLSTYPTQFSFEKDALPQLIADFKNRGWVRNDYFIDIGIPSDYQKAQTDFINF